MRLLDQCWECGWALILLFLMPADNMLCVDARISSPFARILKFHYADMANCR